jgi:ubiquinone/menaquinone biosynthesis C-methylase UbiE
VDDASFEQRASVQHWRDIDSGLGSPLEGVDLTGGDAPYWLYHMGRFGFFAAQGLLSVGVAQAALSIDRSRGATNADSATPQFLSRLSQSPGDFIGAVSRTTVATFRQDLDYIKNGYYRAPFDMSPSHRQWSPAFIADKSLQYVQEAVGVLRRSAEKGDTGTWMSSGNELYPPYYRHTFHYQTDGWLSSRSAEVYETSTEVIFSGRQDAMQRTSLVHISDHLRNSMADRSGKGVRLLEHACGTGRLMTFVRDNWPSMDVAASDLSPFYLEEARKNNAYWEGNFAPKGDLGQASFVQANAERLPFEDGSFDIVLSVYLFHEVPAEAQDNIVAEAARVLAPGGTFVLTDSIQLGDRPSMDQQMDKFGGFAEPYYMAYIRRDLAELARAHGLEPGAKEISGATKSLTFVKRHPVDAGTTPGNA